ncbi:2-octaprenylphenol hydroxylase [Limosilactobacillus gastricus PS3]|uniref:2-octaprenylphenol hydroxylase n=1 Tax=Limosilactobacillus gastricus PS3 TaxID=1144300 RepID=H4GJ70_9LACO|nr:AarF/UbiB family protein [Limosilactobacillus gastricus]EHS87025.1 2-octaprenylphenol hydroxylase [Limosilactobacillus gastricus PS3]
MTTISGKKRLLQIISVLKKYSFISNFYRQTNPDQIRQALEELGPTFIKLGQILSTRPDLVSPALINELQQLQDKVKADDYEVIAQIYEEQTGQTIAENFASFEETAFASASIGQCHHATLLDGTPVVVKIQHPDVSTLVQVDLNLFRRAVKMLKYVPNDGKSVVDLPQVFDQLSTSLMNEIDTLHEVKNGERFYDLNNGQGVFVVPQVYPNESSTKVLVDQAMTGDSIKQLFASEEHPLSTDEQARNTAIGHQLVENFIKQVFTDHFFHADPHPGNILYRPVTSSDQPNVSIDTKTKTFNHLEFEYQKASELPPFRLIYLDFGMMGTLSNELADGIANIIIALVQKDIYKVSQAVLAVCNRTGQVDEQQFNQQFGIFIRPYLNQGLGDIDFGTMVFEITRLCQTNHLQMKPEVTMLMKAFATLEGTVAKLDPTISMMAVARPFAKKYLKEHFNWRESLGDASLAMYSSLESLSKLPNQVNRLMTILASGEQQFNFHYQGQDKVLKSLHKMVNQLATVIVIAAVIMGSSIMVVGSSDHPFIHDFGIWAYVIAIFIVVIMMISWLWKSWRK